MNHNTGKDAGELLETAFSEGDAVESVGAPDPLTAVYDFLRRFIVPDLEGNSVIRGLENRAALPAGSNEQCVYAIRSVTRCGTNVHRDEAVGERDVLTTVGHLNLCDVQLDFYSDSMAAYRRACLVELLARDGAGVAFFEPYGIACIDADAPTDASGTDASQQQVKHFMTVLHLEYWTTATIRQPGFDSVALERIENVDVHHRPDGICAKPTSKRI